MCHSGDVTDPASPPADPPPPPVNLSALLSEALSKSDVCWIRTPTWTRAVWHAYDREAVLIVTGPGEQSLPALPDEVELILRSKDAGSRLLRTSAKAVVLPPEHPMWPAAAAALAAERLNATDDQLTRWRESATIYVLHPYGLPIERPGEYAVAPAAEAVHPAAATTSGWRPRHLGGRARG